MTAEVRIWSVRVASVEKEAWATKVVTVIIVINQHCVVKIIKHVIGLRKTLHGAGNMDFHCHVVTLWIFSTQSPSKFCDLCFKGCVFFLGLAQLDRFLQNKLALINVCNAKMLDFLCRTCIVGESAQNETHKFLRYDVYSSPFIHRANTLSE